MLCSFTTRCHNFIWFLIFTFTLYCMPNYELLFPYKIHFGIPEAEAAETTEQSQAQASETNATSESASSSSAGTTATASETSSGDSGSSGQSAPAASFTVDDFTGGAHLSYPIVVPPARSGLAPQISLNYASSGGNGWIGVGWGLSVGSIQRKGPRRGVPKYNDTNDVYELNLGGAPQELVPIGNDEYRLKIEGAYFRVKYYSVGNYWMVWDKSGIKMTFGSTVNSRIGRMRDPNVKDETLGWCLDRAEDPKTNYMEIIYFRDQDVNNTYQIYLQKVKYNGQVAAGLEPNHHVIFILENRPDPIYNYRGGFKMLTRKRLYSIEIKTNDSLVRRYQLQYTVSNTRSLLSSIIPYGNDNTSTLPPTTFTYQTHSLGFQNSAPWPNPTADLWTVEVPPEKPHQIGALIRDTAMDGTRTDVMDINGDGLVERVVYDDEEPYNNWGVYHNTLHGFVAKEDGTPWAWSNPSAWDSINGNYIRNTLLYSGSFTDVIDMNGDGFPDRVVYSKSCTPPNCPWSVYFNNGIGGFINVTEPNWPNPSAWGSITGNYIRGRDGFGTYADVVDMNGDGLPDRVVYDRITPNKWLVYLNNGTGFDQAVEWPNATGYIRNNLPWREYSFTNVDLIDMNGDGLPDRVIYNTGSSVWLVYLNNGAGFDQAIEWTNASNYIRFTIANEDGFSFTLNDLFDINGDGLPDRVLWGSPWTVYLNNGSGFGPGVTWNNGGGFIRIEASGTLVDNFDINGDGLVDQVNSSFSPNSNWGVSLNSGPVPDLLSKMANSIGGSIEITYRPSTEYDNTGSDGKWHLPFIAWTVSSYVQKDGRGNSYTSRHDYAHGYYDPVMVEFRGFRNVTSYQMFDSQSYESKTETKFYQDYYLKGRVEQQTLTSKEGHRKQIVNNWLLADTLGGGKFPHLDTVTTTVTDQGAGGPFSYSHTTKDVYDIRPSDLTNQTFNLLEEHKNEGTPEEIVTSLEYTSDYTNWILSKPTKITVTGASGAIASRKWMDYNAFGELTTEEVCNSKTPYSGCIDRNLTQNVITSYQYDPTYKVLNQVIDPRGYPTTITYDSTKTHVYKSTKCIDGGKCFTTTTEYDPGTGNLIKLIPPYLQDLHGTPYWFQTQYDPFGRKILDRLKDNSDPNAPPIVDRGSTSYSYNDFGNPNGQYILRTGRIVIEGAPERTLTLNGATYFDGLGRTYLAMTNGPDGKTIVTQTLFDNIGRVWKQSKPYFYGSETPYYAETAYDGFSRATDAKKLDGYYVHTIYQGLKKVVSKQASASVWYSTAYTYDLDQKLRIVEEDYNISTGSSYSTTQYVYDILGNLTQVRAAKDASGNDLLGSPITTTMTYDSLLKKRSMNDPDMGS